jgi:hypothetical protein
VKRFTHLPISASNVKLFTAMALVETTLEHRVFLERKRFYGGVQIAERPTGLAVDDAGARRTLVVEALTQTVESGRSDRCALNASRKSRHNKSYGRTRQQPP